MVPGNVFLDNQRWYVRKRKANIYKCMHNVNAVNTSHIGVCLETAYMWTMCVCFSQILEQKKTFLNIAFICDYSKMFLCVHLIKYQTFWASPSAVKAYTGHMIYFYQVFPFLGNVLSRCDSSSFHSCSLLHLHVPHPLFFRSSHCIYSEMILPLTGTPGARPLRSPAGHSTLDNHRARRLKILPNCRSHPDCFKILHTWNAN